LVKVGPYRDTSVSHETFHLSAGALSQTDDCTPLDLPSCPPPRTRLFPCNSRVKPPLFCGSSSHFPRKPSFSNIFPSLFTPSFSRKPAWFPVRENFPPQGRTALPEEVSPLVLCYIFLQAFVKNRLISPSFPHFASLPPPPSLPGCPPLGIPWLPLFSLLSPMLQAGFALQICSLPASAVLTGDDDDPPLGRPSLVFLLVPP